jgi:predicted Zn-dependent protease
VDRRSATASTTRTGPHDIRSLAERAVAAARLRPPDPFWPGLPPPEDARSVEHWDEATASADPQARASVVRAFIDAARGLEAAGFCATTAATVALANSSGLRRTGRSTRAELSGVARTGKADGSASQVSVALGDLDGDAAGVTAHDTAVAAGNQTDIDAGDYEVVLAPRCVASILDFLGFLGFNGKAHAEGRSFVCLDDDQLDRRITLRDDASDPRTLGVGFDAEGTPKRMVELVRAGRSAGLVYDRRTALRQGVEPTGHAVGDESAGAMPTNLVLDGGDRSSASLVAGMSRGLVVHDFWYLRPLDPKTLVVTGLTRNGVFLVEDGRIRHAVPNLRFTQSFVAALGDGNVRGIGDDGRLAAGDMSSLMGFAHHTPTLHLGRWHFTGGARG